MNPYSELYTYDSMRFPLVGAPQQRDGTSYNKDQRFLNCFAELIKTDLTNGKKYYVKKRPGLQLKYQTGAPGAARGCYFSDINNQIYFVFGNILYSWSPDYGGFTGLITLTTSTGDCGFTAHQTTSANYVVMLDGNKGYVINTATNTVAVITDANFPTPHVPTPVSLDGYLFVAKLNTADLYNSNVNDPMTWTSGNFITAEMYPETLQAIVKNNNYIYAVGTNSVEYFYDAANATGSPLSRNDSAVVQFGTEAPSSVVQTEKEVLFVGNTNNGGRTVWMLDGFKQTEIGTESINQALDAMGSSISTATAFCIRTMGHKFYVLRVNSRTWVYDFDEKLWHEWSSGLTQTAFVGHYACDSYQGRSYMMCDNSSGLFAFEPTHYTDDVPGSNTAINVQIVTTKVDMEHMNRKDLHRLYIFGDWPPAVSSTITLDWSDDDYQTWQGGRAIQLDSTVPCVFRLGKFRRRAFRFTYTDPYPLRLEGFELYINKGSS